MHFIYFYYGNSLREYQNEITESSRIDGANEFEIFLKVIMPISKPTLASVAIMAFIRAWNDFLGPLVFLGSDRLYTLSLAASMLKSNYDPNWDLLLPLGVVMVLPVLLLLFCTSEVFYPGYNHERNQRIGGRYEENSQNGI